MATSAAACALVIASIRTPAPGAGMGYGLAARMTAACTPPAT